MPTIKARIQNKHDTLTNWNKATTFRPLPGELIIFEPTTAYPYPRFKVGEKSDDTTNKLLKDLPFVPTGDVRADGVNTFTSTNTFAGTVHFKDNSNLFFGSTVPGVGIKLTFPSVTTGPVLTLPATTGTIALTSDIPSLTGYAKTGSENIFTAKNTFTNSAYVQSATKGVRITPTDVIVANGTTYEAGSGGLTQQTKISPNRIDFYPVNAAPAQVRSLVCAFEDNTNKLYFENGANLKVLIPNSAGTLALTNDITVKADSNNTFTGTNTYYGDYVALSAFYPTVRVDSGILKVGQVTSNNDTNHTPTGTFASSTDYGNGSITYRPNSTTYVTYGLPNQSGTLALTKDITTVVANPATSGTTTLTKLTVGNTTYNLPSGGSGDVTAAGDNIFTGTNTFNGVSQFVGSIQTAGTNSFSVQGIYNISLPIKAGTVALTSDIKITDTGDNLFVGNNTFQGLTNFEQIINIMDPNSADPDPIISFCKDSDSVATNLHVTSFDGDADLYLPLETGTLATQEWTKALFTYSNNTLTINI